MSERMHDSTLCKCGHTRDDHPLAGACWRVCECPAFECDPSQFEGLMSVEAFPAPWRIDAFQSVGGAYVWCVRAGNHAVVLENCGEEIARRVVEARNGSGELDEAVESVRTRWQSALDAAHAETERVRQHFVTENSKQREEIYRLQAQLQETVVAGTDIQQALDLGA